MNALKPRIEIGAGFTKSFDVLHEAAIAQSGLDDFGDTEYHEGLRVLLDALDQDLRLTELGVWFVVDMVISVLGARLFTQAGWKKHPEFRKTHIARPLVIAGLPRTGSTALHKLLAVDPQFQGLDLWLTATPMPRPPREAWSSSPQYRRYAKELEVKRNTLPGFYAVHDVTIDKPDECIEVLRQSFVSNAFTTFGNSNYQTWWWRQNEAGSYRRYADVLRLIGLSDLGRKWLLKSPGQHVWGLEWVFENFPDACVVQTHRDPAKVIPSVCSLSASRQQLIQGDQFRPGAKGIPEALKWRHALDREKPHRKRYQGQIFDIRHNDFLADPIGTVKALYHCFGLDLTSETEAKMKHWIDNQPPEQKTGHRYSAKSFGLTEGGLRELFSDYIDRFDLVARKGVCRHAAC